MTIPSDAFSYAARVNQHRDRSAARTPAGGFVKPRIPRDRPDPGLVRRLRRVHQRMRQDWPRGSRWLLLALAVAMLLLLAAMLFRRPLADRFWPEARAQELREQAALALAQGRLTAADGSGARELYEAALAIDPDRTEARSRLMRVADAALVQARTALAADRFIDAHRALRLARELSVPRAQADAVAAQLRRREAALAGIDSLLVQAAAARKAGRLDGAADAALPLYRRVLALQPERVEALEGREDTLADLLQQAREDLQRGALAQAAVAIATAREFDAGHVDLPAAQSQLTRAIEQARQRADRDLRRGRLSRAMQGYRTLLQVDIDDTAAGRGLERVAEVYAQRAERHAVDFRFADADTALRQARALAPRSAAVRAASRHVARARQAQARLGSRLPVRERGRRVRALLAEADAAVARGDLLSPPGDSAFDKVRAARALAPADPHVQQASMRLLPAARSCFERELRGNNLGRARACLDAWRVLEGDGAALRTARRRLAQRWLAVGDERLAAGELQSAAAAFNAARAIDPATPGLDAFAERLRVASGGSED